MCATAKEAKLKKKYGPGASEAAGGILSITNLKLLALPFMLLDHVYEIYIDIFDIPIVFKYLGRIVYPIFILAVIEGYHYTTDKKKYIIRLLISSCLMYIGNYLLNNILPRSNYKLDMNIFVPLMFILLYLYLIDNIMNKKDILFNLSLIIITLPGLNYIGQIPYVMLGVLLYQLRDNKLKQTIFYCLYSLLFIQTYQVYMILAAPLIYLYNGQKGKGYKNLFYAFYPGHIYIMYIISIIILRS